MTNTNDNKESDIEMNTLDELFIPEKTSDESVHGECGESGSNELNEKKKKKKKKKKQKQAVVYGKGVETMYRNAYRAQLDMISLAAMKANIMISLNGLIVSILLVSGSVLYNNNEGFIIPVVLFLVTSVLSIYFALSSASPEPPKKEKKLFPCLYSLFTGKISFAQFKAYRSPIETVFDREHSNILIFEDFAKVSKDVYLDCMNELIMQPDKLYTRMSDQLYYLGVVANKKFLLLRYSYSIFRWGLILSITIFILINLRHSIFPHQSQLSADIETNSEIKTFKNIYEPSGVQMLPDGRLILIEDEISSALHLFTISDKGELIEDKYLSGILRRAFKPLNDLEAITLSEDGYIYAITSHQRNSSGERMANREQLIRFKLEGNKVVDAKSYGKLHHYIEQSGILGKVDEQGFGGIYNINIEAMYFNKKNQLMIGFRAPLRGEKSIVAILENPADIFEHDSSPIISKNSLELNLHGGGIRAMTYDEVMGGYLMTNEVYGIDTTKKRHSQLLFWDGKNQHRVHHLHGPDLKNIEGIAPIQFSDQQRVLIVSDNGKKLLNKPANYVLLKYKQLTK